MQLKVTYRISRRTSVKRFLAERHLYTNLPLKHGGGRLRRTASDGSAMIGEDSNCTLITYYSHFHRDLPDLFSMCSHHPNSNIQLFIWSLFFIYSFSLCSGILFGQLGNTIAEHQGCLLLFFFPLLFWKLSVWVLVTLTALKRFSDAQTFWIISRRQMRLIFSVETPPRLFHL